MSIWQQAAPAIEIAAIRAALPLNIMAALRGTRISAGHT
jgi:hypothetical protein